MIRNYLKDIYLFASLLLNTLVSVFIVLLLSSFRINKEMSKCVKKYKKSSECVVLGNGPSIANLFEKKRNSMHGKDIFAVNYFCLTNYFDMVKPKFYVMLDPDLYKDDSLGSKSTRVEELIAKLNSITWEMVIFVPVKFKNRRLTESFTNNKLIVIPFNSSPIKGLEFIENLIFKINLGMPNPITVINAAIFLAVNLKYDIVNLYGVEQSWLKHLHVTNDNQVNVRLPHFYGGPDDIGRHSTLNTLSSFLYTQAICFESHMRIEKYSKYNDTCILNHTPGSYIDAYDRVVDE